MKRKIYCLLLSLAFIISASLPVYASERSNSGNYDVEQVYNDSYIVDRASAIGSTFELLLMTAATNPCCLVSVSLGYRPVSIQIIGTLNTCRVRWSRWDLTCSACGRLLAEGIPFISATYSSHAWRPDGLFYEVCTICWVRRPVPQPFR